MDFPMEPIRFTTHSAKETQRIARLFARELANAAISAKGALVVALEGDLGGGKTTFAQGFANGLGIRENVLSPTFVILKSYKLRIPGYTLFCHIDAYRLKNARELQILGWEDILQDVKAIILVEWADRVRAALPQGCIRIAFEFLNENERRITMQN
jgi:tRNA threonylcarbamoyladenosine biosynthesis protein TsaE